MRCSKPGLLPFVLLLGACVGGQDDVGVKDEAQDDSDVVGDSGGDDSAGDDSGGDDSASDDSGEEQTPGWSNLVFPLIQARCDDCHDYWGPESALAYQRLTEVRGAEPALVTPGDAAGSLFYQKLGASPPKGGQMPLQVPAVSEAKIEAIRDWINEGAPEDQLWTVFGELYKGAGSCWNCHRAWGEAGPTNTSALQATLLSRSVGGYTLVVPGDAEESLLYLKLVEDKVPFGQAMPLSYSFVSDEDLAEIAEWIDAGAVFD
ncbi:MAG: hypothetical protein IPO67_22600 [Deltaproteobacteria bacterium]|nr:hypothetical protein [Deltaproteobacteria bacterium]